VELKSWGSFSPKKVARQLMLDYFYSGGFTTEVVWAFEEGQGPSTSSEGQIIGQMERALDQALLDRDSLFDGPGAPERVAKIKAKLPDIVRLGAKKTVKPPS
jgi:hypothetical protein